MDDRHSINLQVIYESELGFLELRDYTVSTGDAPLIDTIRSAFPESQALGEQTSVGIQCFGETPQGPTIDLSKKPNQIPYLMEAPGECNKRVLYICRERHASDSGISSRTSTGSSHSSDLEIRHSEMVSKMMDIVQPLDAVQEDEDNLFEHLEEYQGSSDSDEDENVFPNPIQKKNLQPTQMTATLPAGKATPSEKISPHEKSMTLSPIHPNTIKRTQRVQTTKKRPVARTVSESDIGPQNVTLLRMKKTSFEEGRQYFTNTDVEGIAPASLVDISTPQPTVSFLPTPEIRPLPARRRRAFKRKSIFDLDIREQFPLKSLQITTKDAFGHNELQIVCHNYSTVKEVKQAIILELESKKVSQANMDPSTIVLTYAEKEKEYELLDDSQFLMNTLLYQKLSSGDAAGAVTVQQLRDLPTEELRILHSISRLTGVLLERATAYLGVDARDLAVIPAADQAEVQWARRTLHDCVMKVAASRDDEEYSLSMELATKEIEFALAEKISNDGTVSISFHYKDIFFLKKTVNVQQDAESVLQEVFPCVVACRIREVEDRIEDYTLQMTGEQSYIHGKFQLINFKDIRRCLLKGEPIHLSVTKRPSPEKDKAYSFSWLPVDPQTTCPLLHSDVSANGPIFRTESESAWENGKQFRFQLQTIENLQTEKSKNDISVSASLYHGTKPLLSDDESNPTTRLPIKSTFNWNKEFAFGIQIKNLPKATKLMLVVDGSKLTHWGLISVFDHRGILRTGKQVIRLWTCKNKKTAEKESNLATNLNPNPAGPAANNPDPEAVTVTICFKETKKPIIFPSTAKQSLDIFFRQHPAVRDHALRKTFRSHLKVIKDKNLFHRIPSYIAMVKWSDISSLEVYTLLHNLEDVISSIPIAVYSLLHELEDVITDIPIETALRLLDCDFPDEAIREFATRVLERVTDERLEDLLLQLTQALKFEANHDSALARFLLKRALTNKRIGHFFFWYLKCEMYNPQYTARFAVIMEAYLKACGKSMLTKFIDQAKIQATLETIGKQLKEKCDSDHTKMQEMLPAVLESAGVSKCIFTAIYNPRLKLGNLRPSKCKVMPSAKKPLWLEMQNVHPTALQQTPTRLILKLGDDLRQDMITLRMFSLFEKLWEEEGLDLCLIPYGCMATGPKTGFIEVVRNAKTIAEVSETNNNKKLYEWIKSQQINEYGEVDSDKLATAVDTFVRSCAGYSVATYVLGIGDRHNDNIMVTTSGNLFHIDFGHFLGNIKYYMGFKREWAPFVLTPDFVYVMGGERSDTFATYKKLCCRAFLTLRKHADLIINLFSMMRSTGIPELTCVEDTDYIRTVLMLSEQEHEAERHFEQKVIKKCLGLGWTVQVMWWMHLRKKRTS